MSKAKISMDALRARLQTGNPKFADASAEEARMVQFCGEVRHDLSARRQRLNLHQEEIAARLNLTQSAISKIEAGRGDIAHGGTDVGR